MEEKVVDESEDHFGVREVPGQCIHSKNEFCGGDGYLGKKIGGKFGLKMA